MAGYRVMLAEFKHETNTFCSTRTTKKDFEARYLKFGDEILSFFTGKKVEMGGFIAGCEEEGLEMVPVIAGNATPGGIVSRDVFDLFLGEILGKIESEKGKIDGILLSLHGAMVTEDHFDGEGVLLSSIRRAAGSSIPIVATLDLHANISGEMIKNADIFFPYESYPHIDQYDRAYESARALAGLLRAKFRPVMRVKRIPMLVSSMLTAEGPVKDLTDRIHELEEDPRVVNAAFLHGFSWADTPYTCASALAVTNGDEELAEKILEEIATMAFSRKQEYVKQLTPVEEAVRIGMSAPRGPVILADLSDNPGGGGTADGTHILSKLVEMEATNVGVAIITDPEVVSEAIAAGVGATIEVKLGGKVEAEEIYGRPVEVTARVKTITDGIFVNKGPMAKGLENNTGRTVVLDIAGIEVIVPERRMQPWDPEIFRRNGIEPSDKQILVLKSTIHFRAAYGDMAARIIEVDAPGLLSSNFRNFRYRHLERPVFPLD